MGVSLTLRNAFKTDLPTVKSYSYRFGHSGHYYTRLRLTLISVIEHQGDSLLKTSYNYSCIVLMTLMTSYLYALIVLMTS